MSTDHHPVRLARARLALDGLSVGDAFGERFIHGDRDARERVAARALPPGPWCWTDDTAMALDLVEVLETHRTIDQDALAATFARRWARQPGRGYGGGAFRLLHRVTLGEPWRDLSAALFPGGSMGNGAAMRVAPLGAYAADLGWDRVVAEARASAEVTHAHPEGIAGGIAVALAAAWACGERAAPLFEVVLDHTPRSETRERIAVAAEFATDSPIAAAAAALGTGASVLSQDTVAFCLWCAARHLDDFSEAMWATVAGFGDCDTTCAIVGGIVAGAVGAAGIPAQWLARREPIG
ncbi:MAG: ADP-ribosylglycohydrolase family protein [Sandaracinaceae bacterium]|nr:ADP-ribosylglycohydrolase family protein [Sandaracinaceae bacterium]